RFGRRATCGRPRRGFHNQGRDSTPTNVLIMNETAEIDPSGLTRLSRWGGPPFVKKMILLFFQEMPLRLNEARKGTEKGDLEVVANAGHSIKSSALNFGASHFSAVAQQLEICARENRTGDLPALLNELDGAFARAKSWLESQLMTIEP